MSSTIRNNVRDYLRRELAQDRTDLVLSDDVNLLKEHIIDSLGIFMLVTYLEEQYGIVIDADEVLAEHFETVASIGSLVEAKLEGASATKSA